MHQVKHNDTNPLTIQDLLIQTVTMGGSDLHLVVGFSPAVRVNGAIVKLDHPIIKNNEMDEMLMSILSQIQQDELRANWDLDFSYSIAGFARYRGSIMRQRGSLAAVFRVVPYEIPAFETLGLPDGIKQLCELSRGLVLVTGPTGSGKSTTLAAMLDIINRKRAMNIITIEDPIEFLHHHEKSTVRQREIGFDAHSFPVALRHVLRHDPDIIMIGEMRDLESISIALTAAETGHLVLSTLHTQTAPLTISRIIDIFNNDRRSQVRMQLANTLKAVISQQLLPRADGKGRIPAVEFMTDTPAIRSLIREGKEHQLGSIIMTSQSLGMVTMDSSLVRLYLHGQITLDSVFEYCIDKTETERMLRTSR